MKGTFRTLFTSAENKLRRRLRFQISISAACSVFLIIFNAIYTHFGYGQYSLHMRYMFLFPLTMSCLIPLVIYLLKLHEAVNRLAFNLWNASVATFVFGCIVKGVIEISGRQTDFEKIYFSLGSLLAMISVISLFVVKNERNRTQN